MWCSMELTLHISINYLRIRDISNIEREIEIKREIEIEIYIDRDRDI